MRWVVLRGGRELAAGSREACCAAAALVTPTHELLVVRALRLEGTYLDVERDMTSDRPLKGHVGR
jgi:hypothetical protein